jgi:protein-L-isoaspartate O-methyltransferase
VRIPDGSAQVQDFPRELARSLATVCQVDTGKLSGDVSAGVSPAGHGTARQRPEPLATQAPPSRADQAPPSRADQAPPSRADQAPPSRADQAPESRADQARLVFASFMMLFVELALIRWVTANNVYITKATNFMLLASFLGIGIGFLNARARRDYLRWAPLALLALVGFVLAFPVILVSLSGSHPYQGLRGSPALPQPVSLTVIFLLTVAVMAGIGQGVARIFVKFQPLRAYRLDILGSLAGIAVFSGLAFLDLPPAGWGFIAGFGLLVVLAPRVRWWQAAAVLAVITLLCLESFLPRQMWSPYNKLSVYQVHGRDPILNVSANNIPYQAARSLAAMRQQKPFYFYPYRHVTRADLGNVLVIGAGTGNDSAVALAEGARHVDAVEIDPLLVRIGHSHPNHPYADPRLTVHIADGREYLQDTHKRYNLIMFALPDSLSALAGQSAIRLESYLLTQQSIAAAKADLAPGGTFAMYNYYAPFLLNRYATTVQNVFHTDPCAEVGPPLGGRRLAVLTVHSEGAAVPNCQSFWHGTRVAPASDNHPFPYLPHNRIPFQYLWMLAAILAGSLLLIRVGGGRLRRMGGYVDLAFMGAAFLLLETKNVVQFALLFGTTWFVNSLVFAGVLLAVYLAVETASRVKLPRPAVLYVALVAALAVAWVVPPDSLLSLPIVLRFLAGSAVAFAPIFLANLIFAQRFSGVETAGTAFAANLLGAMAGGALEYLALITGYRFLLIVIGALYGLAFVTGVLRNPAPHPA